MDNTPWLCLSSQNASVECCKLPTVCFLFLFTPLTTAKYLASILILSQRGVGAKAVGTSISLVSPAEEREHQKICEAVRGAGLSFTAPDFKVARAIEAAHGIKENT